MKPTCLVLILAFYSTTFFGQSDMTVKENNTESNSTYKTEMVRIEELSISLELSKSWKVKKAEKSKSVVFQNDETKSTIQIYLTDPEIIFRDFLSRAEKQDGEFCGDSVTVDMFVEKLNEINLLPHGGFKFSMKHSQQDGAFEETTTKLIVNDMGVVAVARVELDCADCKKEVDYIIESMQKLN